MKIAKFLGIVGALAPFSALAVADTDGMIGTLDFTGLTANVASVITQAFPVAALVGGIMLGLAFLGWVISTVGRVLRSRRAA